MSAMAADILAFSKLEPGWVMDSPSLNGFLKKYPDKTGLPKKRFFYLKGRYLIYFRNDKSDDPIAGVCLQEFTVTSKSETKFDIDVPERKYALEAESKEDKDIWMTTLKMVEKLPRVWNSLTPASQRMTRSVSVAAFKENGEWLWKRGQKNPGWKERWMVIKQGSLFYYASDTDPKPKGSMPLRNAKCLPIAQEKNERDAKRFKFLIENDKRTLYIYCESEAQRAKWMKRIIDVSKGKEDESESSTSSPSLPSINDAQITTSVGTSSKGGFLGGKKKDARQVKIVEHSLNSVGGKQNIGTQAKSLVEITELVSPTPYTSCYLSAKLYLGMDEEAKRNMEALEHSRGVIESNFDELEDSNDDYIENGQDNQEGCPIS
eukprot:TRINITY_DN7577_c0_g1_i1.p1 TRINITY_DN7577_c0_g1~~TRINITY_DN7577_c0_g1_i1.p1  ORF type:complete len:428 (+),score=77.35 TRINITY_DN7577_c0_g1_i1:159-1286(+)